MNQRVVIIGGGAAGLFAAIEIGRHWDGEVILLEKSDRVGRKLLATGNGRCNLTNADLGEAHFHSVSESHDLRQVVLAQLDGQQTLTFFESIGVVPVEEGQGKIYPASGQASAVLDLLRIECGRAGINERCGMQVAAIHPLTGNQWQVDIAGEKSITADVVLLASGGCASPSLGSDGSGFALAQSLGHSVTPLFPIIVPIETDTSDIRSLKGCKCEAQLSLCNEEQILRQESGEVLFTEYGLSGLPTLQLAGAVAAAQLDDTTRPLWLEINLLPEWTAEDLLLFLQMRLATQGYRILDDFLSGWIHKQIARALLRSLDLRDLNRLAYTLPASELDALARRLQHWRLAVRGNRPFDKAQATAGGVPLCEWNESLQSRLHPSLFAAGEVLDVHGDSGGYNLQWAWSSAHAAARGIVAYLEEQI